MCKGFCLFGLIFLFGFINPLGFIKSQSGLESQIVVPTFGVRGSVPETLVQSFMDQLRSDIQLLGIAVNEGEIINPGIASSLDPEFAYLATQIEGVRYAVLGEIQESQTAFTVSILIADGQQERSSDIISESLNVAQVATTSRKVAQSIKSFLEPTVDLVTGSAGLFVSSQPSEATLLINTIETGETGSVDVISLQPGEYTVELRKEGYLPETRVVELKEGKIETLNIVLVPAAGGSLQVLSIPSAEVFVDNRSMGFTPLTISALPGTHQIRLQRAGFITKISEHRVKDYRVSRVDETLEPQFERMVFWELKDTQLLTIDGVLQSSIYAELPPGQHTVELRRGGEKKSFSFSMPQKGVFALDFENLALIPYEP